jgi:hypothetical protein
MHDPRTRIELPNVLALLLVAVMLTLGYGILNVAESRYSESILHPFRFAGSTLFLACTCAWCLRSVTIDNRPGHDLTKLPLATLVKLPRRIAQFRGHRVRIPMPDYLRGHDYVELDEFST